jgi:hypothetical protein
MLLSLALSPFLAFALPQDAAAPVPAAPAAPAPAADAETKAALAGVLKTLADAGNYAYELKTDGSGGGGGGRRGGGGGEGGAAEPPAPPAPAKVKYEKGLPLHMSRGEMQAFVQGDVIVYLDTEKQTWEKFDPAAMRSGRGGGGGRGAGGGEGGASGGTTPPGAGGGAASGGAEPPAAGAGTPPASGGAEPPAAGAGTPPASGGAEPPPPPSGEGGQGGARGPGGGRSSTLGRMRDLLGVVRAQPPHLVIADVITMTSDVTKADADGVITYKGALTKEAAEKIAAAGSTFGGRSGGGGGDGPERQSSGTFEATVNAAGQLVSLVVDTKIKMSFGDREVERTSKATYTVSDVGAVKIEVPESALQHFEF